MRMYFITKAPTSAISAIYTSSNLIQYDNKIQLFQLNCYKQNFQLKLSMENYLEVYEISFTKING